MRFSVVIPTYNRSDKLDRCLGALAHQIFPHDAYEVVVVDDGSTDAALPAVLEKWNRRLSLRFFHQKNQGQGIARNVGIKHATGDIVVFLGDDSIVTPLFLHHHDLLHKKHAGAQFPVGVLGKTVWDPGLPHTPFMDWVTNGSSIFGRFGGHQFAYEKLDRGASPDFNFFYTSNLSIPRALLKKEHFDPDFKKYGWEDIELGYRLEKKYGLKLFYAPKALAYHDHLLTEETLVPRMEAIGRSAVFFHSKHPALKKVPTGLKYWIFCMLASWPSLVFFRLVRLFVPRYGRDFYYYALSKKAFLKGLHAAQKGMSL